MNRIRSRVLPWLIVISGLLAVRPCLATPERANELYNQGLDSVRAGDLKAARQAFEQAYRESPHYVVLYNLGRVCRDLGDTAAARDYFERYLEEGGERVPADRRQEVTALIQELEEKTQPPKELPPAPPEPRKRAESTVPARHHEASPPPRLPDERQSEIALRLVQSRHQSFAYAFGATGIALIAAGASLWIYNEGRYADWEQERNALEKTQLPEEIRSDDDLEAFAAYQRAVGRNDAGIKAIDQLDVVSWTVAGAGALLLATGAVFYFTAPADPRVRVGAGRLELSVAF
jgi:tetratricopeptide (TPR) repeat protein